jgi:hypothetical protein
VTIGKKQPPGLPRSVAFQEAAAMSIQAFHKALAEGPLSQEERATLTGDELFVLVAGRRLDGLTVEEQQRLAPDDLSLLAAAGLAGGRQTPVAGCPQGLGRP